MFPGTASGTSSVWGGARATYVALCSVASLGLALLASIWHSDVSGTISLLGLLSIYLSSSEMLVLYGVFAPLSVVVDIIRLTGPHPLQGGRGWLIFFTVCGMLAKLAGAVFAWSLRKSITSGEGGASQSLSGASMGGGMAGGMSGPPPPTGPPTAAVNGSAMWEPQQQYGHADPFAAYTPPPGPDGPPMTSYQPFPAQH